MHKIFFYNKFIIRLYMFRALCAHHQEVKIVLYSIWYYHTCRWPSGAQVESGRSQPVHRAVNPTRYTIVSIYFIFEKHSTCFGPSFLPSSGDQDCTDTAVCLLASRQKYLLDKCLLLYVQCWSPDDGRKDHPKHIS